MFSFSLMSHKTLMCNCQMAKGDVHIRNFFQKNNDQHFSYDKIAIFYSGMYQHCYCVNGLVLCFWKLVAYITNSSFSVYTLEIFFFIKLTQLNIVIPFLQIFSLNQIWISSLSSEKKSLPLKILWFSLLSPLLSTLLSRPLSLCLAPFTDKMAPSYILPSWNMLRRNFNSSTWEK